MIGAETRDGIGRCVHVSLSVFVHGGLPKHRKDFKEYKRSSLSEYLTAFSF